MAYAEDHSALVACPACVAVSPEERVAAIRAQAARILLSLPGAADGALAP